MTQSGLGEQILNNRTIGEDCFFICPCISNSPSVAGVFNLRGNHGKL